MHENLVSLRQGALDGLAAAADADALEAWRVRYLSRKGGALSAAMDVIGKLTTVMFLPEDIELVTGAPVMRRRYYAR